MFESHLGQLPYDINHVLKVCTIHALLGQIQDFVVRGSNLGALKA